MPKRWHPWAASSPGRMARVHYPALGWCQRALLSADPEPPVSMQTLRRAYPVPFSLSVRESMNHSMVVGGPLCLGGTVEQCLACVLWGRQCLITPLRGALACRSGHRRLHHTLIWGEHALYQGPLKMGPGTTGSREWKRGVGNALYSGSYREGRPGRQAGPGPAPCATVATPQMHALWLPGL